MYHIGFNNFRKFENLNPQSLGEITILVGANNAGKSTLVKGLMLILDNIRVLKMGGSIDSIFQSPEFRFDANDYHDLGIGTFGRALFNKASKDLISFAVNLNRYLTLMDDSGNTFKRKADFNILIDVTGDKSIDQTIGTISRIGVSDHSRGINFDFNYEANKTTIEFEAKGSISNDKRQELQSKIAQLEEEIEHKNSLKNIDLMKVAGLNAELDKLRKSLDFIQKEENTQTQANKIEFDNVTFIDKLGGNYIVNQIHSVILYARTSEYLSDEDKADPVKLKHWQNKQSDKERINEWSASLKDLCEDLSTVINGISIEYIYAHSVSQNIFYNTADKNDYMAKAIHRFYREKIVIGSTSHTFVKTWMKKFGIGDDFEIISLGGEAYRFYIYDGANKMDLADKGMGSNQVMILLLNLASIIRRYEHSYAKPVIIIEEPEQNLHPALQSRLIELFTEVNKKFGFQFIIETHSEYIVRRAQVFVAQGGYKDDNDAMSNSPYSVYYFPQEGDPYLMRFRKNGKFANEFGAGFFDEAANLAFEIF